MKAVAIVSGGMDSVTLAHWLYKGSIYGHDNNELYLMSFDYGQRHRAELDYAARCAERLGAGWEMVDLSGLQPLLRGSALTDPSVDVPHGHYAAENMKVTIVPNRNAIMLCIATGCAVSLGADVVATGVHAGDHAVYPDCRPQFIDSLEQTLKIANEGSAHPNFHIAAPFLHMTKAEIVQVGSELQVPWEETWSCYEGGEIHCGRCATCVERREAFWKAQVEDPTSYQVSFDESMAVGGIHK